MKLLNLRSAARAEEIDSKQKQSIDGSNLLGPERLEGQDSDSKGGGLRGKSSAPL